MEIKKFEKRVTIKELHLSDDDVKLLTKLADTASKVCSINKATNTECLDCLLQDTFLCHMRNMKKDHIYPLIKEEKIVEIPPQKKDIMYPQEFNRFSHILMRIPQPSFIEYDIRRELLRYRDICRLSNISCDNCKLKDTCFFKNISNKNLFFNVETQEENKKDTDKISYMVKRICICDKNCKSCGLNTDNSSTCKCLLFNKLSSWSDDDVKRISMFITDKFVSNLTVITNSILNKLDDSDKK